MPWKLKITRRGPKAYLYASAEGVVSGALETSAEPIPEREAFYVAVVAGRDL